MQVVCPGLNDKKAYHNAKVIPKQDKFTVLLTLKFAASPSFAPDITLVVTFLTKHDFIRFALLTRASCKQIIADCGLTLNSKYFN